MRAVVQRVTAGSVDVAAETVGQIGSGLVILLAVGHDDGEQQARQMADKIAHLRIFADDSGKFNRSALDVGAEMLVVSQFTLYADTRKGRRPSFVAAAHPDHAESLVETVATSLRETGLRVATGRFGAHMLVRIANDGPVTVILDVD